MKFKEVEALDEFYPAEEYHKDYYAKNKEQAYSKAVIEPKVEKVRQLNSELMKEN